ncbi:MAG: hypothetical protein ACOYYS_10080 [Chloroflexota bacterium]
MKTILVSRSVGQPEETDAQEYVELRKELVVIPQIQASMPSFVVSCRTLQEFWNFIKTKFSHYQERRDFLREQFEPLLSFLEFDSTGQDSTSSGDLFNHQFPAGLPFGVTKPNLAVVPKQGTQKTYFESDKAIGVIQGNVYPNLTFQKLEKLLENTPVMGESGKLLPVLLKMIQTDSEKRLFTRYFPRYHMVPDEVPVLVPQAWIQWHSLTKKNLRSQLSEYADDLYRVDFVAFWAGKRFAILVDDIGHYAKKVNTSWQADEENYSKRLKEDRKLRREGWNVFRISNWEMRNDKITDEILDDLRLFIGFEVKETDNESSF